MPEEEFPGTDQQLTYNSSDESDYVASIESREPSCAPVQDDLLAQIVREESKHEAS